ncbi:MAG: 1-deoxy-D-xylulose-5-phosphate synthase [Clostridia bacterium]|nr:1-deoxy-D-xylulose-5-phosphate synthase [Clostridia bacterium]
MEYKILSTIKSPDDVKKLNNNDLNVLCDEIRDCIITTVSQNGGHLASNLGTVELTVALHRAFNSPLDSILFDVGHQSYTHKLLTGRFDKFSTIRTNGGLSGFMRPLESEHDPFVTGHSGNSVSAAYGIYKAKNIIGEEGFSVAVIGDGAMTGGMAYEALNNAGGNRNKFIVVLNDNKMSISRNVGALSRAFTKMRGKPKYHNFKFAVTDFLNKIPFIGKPIENLIFKIKEGFKSLIYKNNIFSDLGFNYLGPVDGHNIDSMESLFNIAKKYNRPTLIHVITTKGKGYKFAESKPKDYHGVSPFDISCGASDGDNTTFSYVVGKVLCDMAEKDDKVSAITAAMREGTGLFEFSQKYKNRFFDVGIAEQHAMTFAAGMATKGIKPYFAVYSSFLQRSYDQIIHDAAIQKLPVRILVDRAGIVGEDGETHQGIFDISFLTSIPGITIYSPCCYSELQSIMNRSLSFSNITAIRYPKGTELIHFDNAFSEDFTWLKNDKNKCVVSYGREFSLAYAAYKKTKQFDLIKLNKVFPIEENIIKILKNYKYVYFFEESVQSGSISEKISAMLMSAGYKGEYHAYILPNDFIPSIKVKDAFKKYNLDSDSIIRTVNNG